MSGEIRPLQFDPAYCRLTLAAHLKTVGATTGFDPKDATTTLALHLAEQRAQESEAWAEIEKWFPTGQARHAREYLKDFLSGTTCVYTKRYCLTKMQEMALEEYKSRFRRQESCGRSELLRLAGVINRNVHPLYEGIEKDRFGSQLSELNSRLRSLDGDVERDECDSIEEDRSERELRELPSRLSSVAENDTVANARVHGTTRRLVSQRFVEQRRTLQALPAPVFSAAIRLEPRVSHEGVVSVGGNASGVPERAHRRVLDNHAWAHQIRNYEHRALLAGHAMLEARPHTSLLAAHHQANPRHHDLLPANSAIGSLAKFVFAAEDEHEQALHGTANPRVSEGS
ncbi:hypothetical protein MB84_31480 (plasmid) [Pandoraea oxalativorans]|uniref:Uncharacterized protein n=1 Tax=Pandoraea oxalativorans TaxID=573737 RepID=A0A192B123_9BURK|nr:hypothetical protein MB84_31480 [Pandoraea oxalativorans]